MSRSGVGIGLAALTAGRHASLTSSCAHQAWSSPSRRTDSPRSPLARLGLRWASLRLRDHGRAMPGVSRVSLPSAHAGRGRHRRHLHRRGRRRRSHRQGAVVPGRPWTGGARRRRRRSRRRTRPSLLAHGTTVATNALLEGTGAPVALVTTDGPSRRDRDRPPGPAVALRHRGRPAGAAGAASLAASRWAAGSAADGTELDPVDLDAVPDVPDGRRGGGRLPPARRPRARPRAGGRRGAARARASTSPARTRCRPRSASTSARSRPS